MQPSISRDSIRSRTKGVTVSSWRFLNTGADGGAVNMAIDEAMLIGVNRGTTPPTVRVYAWDPPTVSLGYAQRVEDELDLEAVGNCGFGVVRRPTGGRAVLHAGELTYSVVGPAGEDPLGRSIMEAYEAIARALAAGLGRLGVEVELAPVATEAMSRDGASPPCFASAGRYEIVVGGRKLIGSAQRRVGRGVLQHGSLLTDATHERIADVMLLADDRRRETVRRLLGQKTTHLSALLGRPVGFDEVAAAVRLGFADAWGVSLDEGCLTEAERKVAETLATEYAI